MAAAVVDRHPKADVPLPALTIKLLTDVRIVERLRVMDTYNFPVSYTEAYYTNLSNAGWHSFNLLAYYHELLVGSVTCRLEATDVAGVFRLYVMTIGVLGPYRRLGIGAKLMQQVIDNVMAEQQIAVSQIALHVQVGSTALAFYQQFGFTIVEEVKQYYKDLDQRDALLLSKVVPQPNLKKDAPADAKTAPKKK
jgi:N-alpha-acetyltransferase 50